MTVVTVTVNQWHIKANATEGTNLPVICVNRYQWVDVSRGPFGDRLTRVWGPKIGETEHHYDYDVPAGHMIYDPVNKTPCGASCWMEYAEYTAPKQSDNAMKMALSDNAMKMAMDPPLPTLRPVQGVNTSKENSNA